MSARIVRHLSFARLSVLGFVVVALATAGFLLVMGPGFAMPMEPTDESKVPHYFGPWPNWALSPVTSPDVTVTIDGDGTGATATATVGANGAVTGVTITNTGAGYSYATVSFTGAGSGAAANAVVTGSGAVTAINVDTGGGGYTAPTVTISGGGATTDATASAFGSVDALTLTAAGSGYSFPTVDFDMPDDPDGVQARGHIDPANDLGPNGEILAIHLDEPGSGYATAPNVVIRDGTLTDPVNNGATGATASATLTITSVVLDTFGAGYTSAPTVTIDDPTGTGATATAVAYVGAVTQIDLVTGGSGYLTSGGIKKFADALPGLCDPAGVSAPACPTTGKYIPIAVPDLGNPYVTDVNAAVSQSYEIGLVQYETSFSSSLPNTLVRGYVQLETPANAGVSQHYPLVNTLRDGTQVPVLVNGAQAYAVTPPQYLGPAIVTPKDQAVRIVFRNLLPTGDDGDLFLPVDTTIMGSGMSDMSEPYDPTPVPGGTVMDEVRNPMCTDAQSMGMMCFVKNRATLHLHGGNTPWISDGTPHQWITPAGEMTNWPEGVSVASVPDMNVCEAGDDGCQTFYYTNQQSARLMFYHDHSWGITRLNVYAGEAAPYIITDAAEQKLVDTGRIPGPADTIPLVVQDKTFVPQDAQLYDDPQAGTYGQDPTWDQARWGGYGSLWYHHVYMPAQNPGDPSGMSAYGRWMFAPWFWPPQDAKYPPIDNPYYDPSCNLDVPSTWTYDTDPYCEPRLIPGTPNISAGMEQFNDTPLVNGVAYPTVTVEPKTYRFRILNAANDRFFNLQWYVGDPSTADALLGATEVAFNEAELAAAQTDPVIFPTPDTSDDGGTDPSYSLPGPDWVQIANESGFLPAPVVVDGQQVTTWITDPTLFGVGNVDQHSLLLAPAERGDVIVDFSKFAGQTLILYNDAPAAFPARIPSYDYYTGAPDLAPNGAAAILPGYGPNTRTIMQVKVAANAPATAFNLRALRNAFSHKADGSGVFESSQPPTVVGQAAYNSAYGQTFAASGYCDETTPDNIKCDGYARINQQGGDLFKFDTLRMKSDGTYPAGFSKVSVKIEPKAIQDETSESVFDEFGRMSANLGTEVVPAIPGVANTVLDPFVFPTTEILDTTNLPSADMKVTPIATGDDGTQIWKITHNGVDTHPIHFHATDVQLLNRVNWDNVISAPDPAELGWKETVRVAPLMDTYFAIRPIVPKLPWEVPNSIRLIDPMRTDGTPISLSSLADTLGLPLAAFAPNGEPIDVYNHPINFGAEYVYHCHILSHEEMDMMRPVSFVYPPWAPEGLTATASTQGPKTVTLTWTDTSIAETAFLIQRKEGAEPWADLALVSTPLDVENTTGLRSFVDDTVANNTDYAYRVIAQNTVGDTWDYADPNLNEIVSGGFPTVTASSDPSNTAATVATVPAGPTNLRLVRIRRGSVFMAWTDNANNEAGFVIERSADGGATWTQVGTNNANDTTFDNAPGPGTFAYRVKAFNVLGDSAYSNVLNVQL
jgi:FtsP/CotA-like multicopper oxidase with cupredoxin domain